MRFRRLMLLAILVIMLLSLLTPHHVTSGSGYEGLVEVYYKEPPVLLLPNGSSTRAGLLFVEVIALAPLGPVKTKTFLLRPGQSCVVDVRDVAEGWERFYASGEAEEWYSKPIPTISITITDYGDDGAVYMYSIHVSTTDLYYAELGDWRLAARKAAEDPLRIFEEKLTIVVDSRIRIKPCYAFKQAARRIFNITDQLLPLIPPAPRPDYEIIWPELYENRDNPPDTWFERVEYEGPDDPNWVVHEMWYWFADSFSKAYYIEAEDKAAVKWWMENNLIEEGLHSMDYFIERVYVHAVGRPIPGIYWEDTMEPGIVVAELDQPFYGGELRVWNESADPAVVMLLHALKDAITRLGVTFAGIQVWNYEEKADKESYKDIWLTSSAPRYIAYPATYKYECDAVLVQYIIEKVEECGPLDVYRVTPIIAFIPWYTIDVDLTSPRVLNGEPPLFENVTWSGEHVVVYATRRVEETPSGSAYSYEDVLGNYSSIESPSGGIVLSLLKLLVRAVMLAVLGETGEEPGPYGAWRVLGSITDLVSYTLISYQSMGVYGFISVQARGIICSALIVSKLTLRVVNASVSNVPVMVKYFIDVGDPVRPSGSGGSGTHGEDLSAGLMGVDCYAASGNMPYSASGNASVQAGYLDEASSWLEFKVYPPASLNYTVTVKLYIGSYYHVQGSGTVSLSAILEVYDSDHNLVARKSVEVFRRTSSGSGLVSKTVTLSIQGIPMDWNSTYYVRVKIAGSASVPTSSSGAYAWLDCYSWEDYHYAKLEELHVIPLLP